MKENDRKSPRFIMLYIMVALALAGVAGSLATGYFLLDKVNAMNKNVEQMVEEKEAEEVTAENDVVIMDEYKIESTEQISDAYKTGDTSALSDRDKEILDMASSVLDEIIEDGMTDYEKELAVYEWMTGTLQGDTGVLTVVPSSSEDSDNPYGVLKYHNAVCVGYATTFRLFMQMLDIECMVVHNSESYHSWALVKLDGEWYHTDIYSDAETGNYSHFNLNDDMMSEQDWDKSFFPASTGVKYNRSYQNAKSLKNIYKIPELVRKAIDENEKSLSYLLDSSFTEEKAQVVEAMLNSINTMLSSSEEYMSAYLSWKWTPVDEGYLLAITYNSYSESVGTEELTEEEQEKLQDAVNEAFGDLSMSAGYGYMEG